MVTSFRHKDQYRAFFTTDEAIGEYMASLLELKATDTLLEPAAGDGHLIAAARRNQPELDVTAYEIHPQYCDNLAAKFPESGNTRILSKDTILCAELDLRESFGPKFTKIIANPPYGGWQELDRRTDLKKRFPGFYVRETYTLFLLRCLRLLEDGWKLVFIIPATFLYLNLHAAIRELILKEYALESVDTFNSSLFPGIAFGYADLCIVCITAKRCGHSHQVRFRHVSDAVFFQDSESIGKDSSYMSQALFLKSDGYQISPPRSSSVIESSGVGVLPMSDIANCVTGFYSGNDKRFLRRSFSNHKRSEDYEAVDDQFIERNPANLANALDGIDGEKCFIPILKGGGYNFVKPSLWFMEWSKTAVAHYKSDKKARFQNSSYYFKRGIGFPMVTSSRPTAALLENSLFDQSVVGIFPKAEVSLEFLLAYCNSNLFWSELKSINPSANNSCKYILRTPVFLPDKEEQIIIESKTKELIHILNQQGEGADLLAKEIASFFDRKIK